MPDLQLYFLNLCMSEHLNIDHFQSRFLCSCKLRINAAETRSEIVRMYFF